MKKETYYKGIVFLLVLAALCAVSAAQSLPGAATATTIPSTAKATPTNMVLDFDLSKVDTNLKPGDSGVLTVVVKNVGTQSAENVQVFVPDSGDLSVQKRWDLGRVDPLSSKVVTTTITVSKNANVGLHTLQVRISFDGYDVDGDEKDDQISVWELPVRIFGKANFQFSVDKGSYYKEVSGRLVLSGYTQDGARDVSTTLSSACASIIGSAKSYVGDLGKEQVFELEYYVQPKDTGVCSFDLSIDYYDTTGTAMKESLPIGIDVKRHDVDFKISEVSYTKTSPGTSANITMSLENVGSASAEDVSVTLDLSAPFTAVGSSERYAGQVASRGSKDFTFQMMIDSSSDIKAYSIPIVIDYFDVAGAKHTITKSVGVSVDGKPEIKVFLESSDAFTAGNKGKVTVNVVNKGFAEVKFLNLKMLSSGEYEILSSPETYIGNLDSDSSDTQEFEIRIKDSVGAGKVPLLFEVSYKEKNSNVDQVDEVALNLNVLSMQEYAQKYPAASPVTLLLTVVGALIGVIVAVLVLWFMIKLIGAMTGFLDRKLFKRKA